MQQMLKCATISFLRLIFLIVVMFIYSCAPVPLVLDKTDPKNAVISSSFTNIKLPKKVIFLSPKEAECPTQCSGILKEAGYGVFVSYIEQKLMQRGYKLVSGAIVSRIEDKLKESGTREKWDRTEKALLLGKDTGADAIFEVRRLYVDICEKSFLKDRSDEEFKPAPTRYSIEVVKDDEKASRFPVRYWEASVELRMIDMDGNVIWTGSKTVETTDIIPQSWKVQLKPEYPIARISREFFGRRKRENYNYYHYSYSTDLEEKYLLLIIDDLIKQLPSP